MIRMWLVSKHVYSMLVTARRSTKNTLRGKGTQGLLLRRCFSSLFSFFAFLLLVHRHKRRIIWGSLWTALCGESWWKTSNRMKSPWGITSPRPTAHTEMHKRSKACGWKANRYCTHMLLQEIKNACSMLDKETMLFRCNRFALPNKKLLYGTATTAVQWIHLIKRIQLKRVEEKETWYSSAVVSTFYVPRSSFEGIVSNHPRNKDTRKKELNLERWIKINATTQRQNQTQLGASCGFSPSDPSDASGRQYSANEKKNVMKKALEEKKMKWQKRTVRKGWQWNWKEGIVT